MDALDLRAGKPSGYARGCRIVIRKLEIMQSIDASCIQAIENTTIIRTDLIHSMTVIRETEATASF